MRPAKVIHPCNVGRDSRMFGGLLCAKRLLYFTRPGLALWAMVTDLTLPAVEVWRLYRGRADGENRIKELKAEFGLDSFCLRDFCATEAALSVVLLAYNLMSVFRHTVVRQKIHHTLSALHHKVLAVGAYWDKPSVDSKPTIRLAIAKK